MSGTQSCCLQAEATAVRQTVHTMRFSTRCAPFFALDGVDMKHHSGIISKFRKRYIKTGVFDASLSGLISELSDVREGSDYNDFFIVSKADTAEQVQSAGTFFGGGRNLICGQNIESVRHLTQTVTQTGQKRDGRNGKNPIKSRTFSSKIFAYYN